MASERRLAALGAIGLFLTLFLPWYQVTLIASAGSTKLQSASATITGWGAFSFVEAAILLVAAGVLTLLFQRAEGRAFHLPGGDGGVISALGIWTCVLVVWRIFDKQGATTSGPSATSSGVEWGIFVALATAAFLVYAGSRIRAAHQPEPPLPGEARAPDPPAGDAATRVRPPRQPADDAATRARRRHRPVDDTQTRVRPPRQPAADAPTPARPKHTAGDDEDATRVRPPRPVPAEGQPRRTSAKDLFEPVVFEEPPTIRIRRGEGEGEGKAETAGTDTAPTQPARAPAPPPADEPTRPLEGKDHGG